MGIGIVNTGVTPRAKTRSFEYMRVSMGCPCVRSGLDILILFSSVVQAQGFIAQYEHFGMSL